MNIKSELEVYKRVLQYNNDYYEKNYKRLNITINFNNIPDCELDNLETFINSLKHLYQYAYKSISFAFAYSKISEEYRGKSDDLCNRYKFDESNYYFIYFIYQYFGILDYILFILNISAELGLKENEVSFKNIKPIIKKINNYKEFSEIWKKFSRIFKEDRKLYDLYNIQKHRHMIGIDHLSKLWDLSHESIDPKDAKLYKLYKSLLGKTAGKNINNMQVKKHPVIKWPDIKYDNYYENNQSKMNDLNKLFDLLWKLPKVRNVVKINKITD